MSAQYYSNGYSNPSSRPDQYNTPSAMKPQFQQTVSYTQSAYDSQYPQRQSQSYRQTEAQPRPQLQTPQPPPQQSFRDYLRTLPMFPLSTENGAAEKARVLDTSAQLLSLQQPEPQLTPFEKMAKGLMSVSTGGDLMNMRKFDNNALKLTAGLNATLAAETMTIVLTRWVFCPDYNGRETQGLVLVDVLQARNSNPIAFNNNPAYVKAASAQSDTVSLILLGKDAKIKANKMWTKKMTTKKVQEVILVRNEGSQVQMEPLMTMQKNMAPIEWAEVNKRFELGWQVPRV